MGGTVLTIDRIKDAVYEVAPKYGVKRVSVFGSYARGDANPNSDVDLRIDKGRLRGLFALAGFHMDVAEKLHAPVDLLTTESLCEGFLKRISKEEIVIYEESESSQRRA